MKRSRKLLSILVALCVICSVIPAAAAADRSAAFALQDLSIALPEASSAQVQILAEADCTLLTALYAETGRMLTVGSAAVTGSEQPQTVTVPLPAGGEGYDTARAFLVDTGTHEPLCDSLARTQTQQRIYALDLPDTWKQELLKADSMGFPLDKLEQETVSGAEMAELLDKLVTCAKPEQLEEWVALLPEFRVFAGTLTRMEAMAALFLAADTIGGRWAEPQEHIGEAWTALDFQFDEDFFPNRLFGEAGNRSFVNTVIIGQMAALDWACLCYNISRPSPISGEFPFAVDEETSSINEDAPPTYAEAVLSVIRLIAGAEADPAGDAQPVTELTAEKDAQLHQDLRNAIDAILNSQTEIVHADTFIPGETYTGTAYYVSSDGDDNNDGLTPETPWSTGKLLKEIGWGDPKLVKPGDAVFFRRGDIFRFPEWTLEVSVENVTLSTYGEGAKPIFTASSESGVGAEKWELVYEDETTGKKIWRFYQDMRDVACVVLDNNDGQVITKRVYEFYNQDHYESCECTTFLMQSEIGVTLLGKLLTPQESLTEDMTIISRPDRGEMLNNYTDYCGKGPLYLRCDAGNPGELFTSIEFSEFMPMSLLWLEASGTVIDNISFRCNGNSYIKANTISHDPINRIHWSEYENTVIQNCEFAYGGASVTFYNFSDTGEAYVGAQGDGIYTVVKNTTIRNNYFHDCLSTTTTYEWALDDEQTDGGYYHVLDNVMVNTIAIRLDSSSAALQYLDSVIIRGNRIWNTGRMDNSGYYYSEGSILLAGNHYGECIIEDNVLYCTENGNEDNGLLNFLMVWLADTNMPTLANNTYVQHRGRDFVCFHDYSLGIDDPDLMYCVRRLLRDTTSEFYIVD